MLPFEFDALVRTRVLVGSGHVWIRVGIGIRIITFMFVSESDTQTWICIRVGYVRVHVRIRVRVGSPLSVGFLLVIIYFNTINVLPSCRVLALVCILVNRSFSLISHPSRFSVPSPSL